MQSVVLEQATAKFILIFIVGTISVTINDSYGVLCFNLYLINKFCKPYEDRDAHTLYLS